MRKLLEKINLFSEVASHKINMWKFMTRPDANNEAIERKKFKSHSQLCFKDFK